MFCWRDTCFHTRAETYRVLCNICWWGTEVSNGKRREGWLYQTVPLTHLHHLNGLIARELHLKGQTVILFFLPPLGKRKFLNADVYEREKNAPTIKVIWHPKSIPEAGQTHLKCTHPTPTPHFPSRVYPVSGAAACEWVSAMLRKVDGLFGSSALSTLSLFFA